MIVQRGNTLCHVVSGTESEQKWLFDYLSFPDESARFRRAWHSDGNVHMMSEVTQNFPAGFINAVIKAAALAKIKIQVKDDRKQPVLLDPKACVDWLRDYQQEALDVVRNGAHQGIFHHVTGAGKGEVVVALPELFPCTWLFLVHSKDIVAQQIARFEKRTGEEVGFIGQGAWNVKRVTCGTFQTVYKAMQMRRKCAKDLIDTTYGLMIDEAHRVPANTFYRVCLAFKNAYFRHGFSGTPFARGDRKSIFLWGAIGPVIHRIPADRLIKAGVLAKPKIRMVTSRQKVVASTWAAAYSTGIVNNVARNKLVVDAAVHVEKPALLFVKELIHGDMLTKTLKARGVKAEFVWGKHKVQMRQAAIRRLVHGDVDVLVCNVIFQEGIDIPELQSVVIASGGKGAIMVLQDVGRGMRRHSSDGKVTKTEFDVIDFADRGCGCMVPNRHRGCNWLEKHTRKRLAAYATEKYEVLEVPYL